MVPMGELLNTHIFLWAVLEPKRLPAATRRMIETPDIEIVVSTVSAWEIATKFRLEKLRGAEAVVRNYPEALAGLHATELPVTGAHALKAGSWALPHRDPFDRMLGSSCSHRQASDFSCSASFQNRSGRWPTTDRGADAWCKAAHGG